MAIYHYLRLQMNKSQKEVLVSSSDPAAIRWVIAQVKTIAPNAVASIGNPFPGDEVYTTTIRGLNNRDYGASLWIARQLGAAGWEPFAVENEHVHFRKSSD